VRERECVCVCVRERERERERDRNGHVLSGLGVASHNGKEPKSRIACEADPMCRLVLKQATVTVT